MWPIAVVILILIFAIWYTNKKEGFFYQGYGLGSYDPSRYPSEITRTP